MHSSDSPEEVPASRRGFLAGLITALTAACAAITIPAVRYLLYPLRAVTGARPWTDLGPAQNLQPADALHPVTAQLTIDERDGWQEEQAQHSVYVVAAKDGPAGNVRVLSSICPHLGCTVQWRTDRGLFVCPCHGGTYAPDGTRISGPPARGMDALPSQVHDGRLQVQFKMFRQLLATQEELD